jgi:protein-tyrosine phosphatase
MLRKDRQGNRPSPRSPARTGRKVLVHCTEGLNRSGVVIARALVEKGQSAPEAIELVRRGRGPSVDGFPALGNQAFTAWLDADDR